MCRIQLQHSCHHVTPPSILRNPNFQMHLMQRNERPVLGKDEVVVPPPVVTAVPQLEHVEHTLTHLASHFVLVLHPLVDR